MTDATVECPLPLVNTVGFLKSGEPYVEAHHAMPVSTKEVGRFPHPT